MEKSIILILSILTVFGVYGQTRSITSQLDSVASCNVEYSGSLHGLILESEAIGIISKPGTSWEDLGTGALIMTTDNSFKPYFLTCYHLTDKISLSNLNTLKVFFLCKSDAVTLPRQYSVVGYKAYSESSDYLLLELESGVSSDPFLSWLGWDRNNNVPTEGTCLHHPFGSNLKISISTSIGYESILGNNSFWNAHWDSGITQKGSSGAPLLNQNNRIVGQVKGAYPENVTDPCDRENTLFGRFDLSWSRGSSNDSLLSVWLDPINTGQTTTNSSKRYHPAISGSSLICNQETYTLSDLAPCLTVEWSLENSSATILSGQGTNTIVVSKSYNGTNRVIANLKYGGITYFTVSHNVTVGTPNIGPLDFYPYGITCGSYWLNGVINSIHIENACLGSFDRYEAYVYKLDNNFNPSQLYGHFFFTGDSYNNISYPLGWYYVKVRGVNDCGYSAWTDGEVEMVDDWLLNINYEASSEMLTVSIVGSSSQEITNVENMQSTKNEKTEIQIWNSTQRVKKLFSNDSTVQISMTGLPSGIYVVRVIRNNKSYSRKFVKQ